MEFFLHLLDQVGQVNNRSELDPTRSFKFGVEERLQCPSGKVAYNKRFDYILSLNIPLNQATNKGNCLNSLVFQKTHSWSIFPNGRVIWQCRTARSLSQVEIRKLFGWKGSVSYRDWANVLLIPLFTISFLIIELLRFYSSRAGNEIVRPRVPLEACLASYSAPEEVHDFYSSALKSKTTAIK